MNDVIVIGSGPSGVVAAIRAADLGARTALVSDAEFGGRPPTTVQCASAHSPMPRG